VPAVAALITAAGALALGIVNNRATRRAATLNKQLADEHDAAHALLEYQYDARKRLYSELGPLAFQLGLQAEQAFWRVHGLALSAKQGRLVGCNNPDDNKLRKGSALYLPSTIYRFMAPLATYWLFQQRVTSVDMSLDPETELRFRLARILNRTWTDGKEIAEILPSLPYRPTKGGFDRETAQQHASLQKIQLVAEAMIVPAAGDDPPRVMSLGDFVACYQDEHSQLRAVTKDIRKLFVDFHPQTRPVLWRLLVAQAHIYAVLGDCAKGARDPGAMFEDRAGQSDPPLFDWLPQGAPPNAEMQDAVSGAHAYLRAQGWESLWPEPTPENGKVRAGAVA
jgi:hypothetical protein